MRSTIRIRSAAALLLSTTLAAGGSWREWGAYGEFGCLHCRLQALGAGTGLGWDELRWNPGTGRDLRNVAPDRVADFKHMRLQIDIPDMNTPALRATQQLTFTPIAAPVDVLSLNAVQMDISSISLGENDRGTSSTRVLKSYDGEVLSVRFDPPLVPEGTYDLVIEYSLEDPVQGMTWTPESAAWPGRAAQIHTQGQPETNRYWFPSHDFPNERLTTELIVTVPEGYLVSSNGREAQPPRTQRGRTTFHWLQDKEHVNYLVSLVVGKFDIVDVAPTGSRIPMPVYVPPGKGGWVQQTYGRTPEMLRVFEERFGAPYPWDRYAQLCVWNFGAGGMENTAATTMYDTAIFDEKALQDADLDGLISHEIAHQWFGNLITCNTWAHIWLNEGWATYSTALWFEARDGYNSGYLNSMYGSLRGVAARDQLSPDSSEFRPAMVSPVYEHPWEVFRRVSNPYPKGSSILHMLRMDLGDDLFFAAVAEYVKRFSNRTVETDDFRRTFEEVTGRSLEHFFEQWCHRPGTPKVHVKAEWKEEGRTLTLSVEQRQRINPDLPAFVFRLPIAIETAGGIEEIMFEVNARRHERVISLGAEPRMVIVDPGLTVLMDLTVDQPAKRFIAQLERGPTLPSRADAAAALGTRRSSAAVEALSQSVRNGTEHHRVRSMAAASLGKLMAEEALVAIARDGVEDARVRLAVVDALVEIGTEAARQAILPHAQSAAESYAVQGAALAGLGRIGRATDFPVLLAGLSVESQHDQVRSGAIRGLAEMDEPEGLEAVIPFSRPGHLNRLRPVAIEAIGKLGHHDRDLAFETLRGLLRDREDRSVMAAAAALVALEDERGIAALEQLAASTRNERHRREAERRRDQLAAALASDRASRGTRVTIEELRREVERLKGLMEER